VGILKQKDVMADWGVKPTKPSKPQKATKPREKEDVGQRGKTAEKLVQALLDEWNTKCVNFAYTRLADSRAARGMVKAQISDYIVWHKEVSIPLEVKSIEHDYRLPKANLDQLPNLKKVELAGAYPLVLVHFKLSDVWRVAPTSYFEFGVPSWDMRNRSTYATAKLALQSTGFFPTA
jgi:hypothetical protein